MASAPCFFACLVPFWGFLGSRKVYLLPSASAFEGLRARHAREVYLSLGGAGGKGRVAMLGPLASEIFIGPSFFTSSMRMMAWVGM